MINSKVIGAINGVLGDYLVDQNNPLAITMDFYNNGQPLNGDIESLTEYFPNWEDTVSIFLHGSSDSEARWTNDSEFNYGTELYNSFNILPLYIRYNSGLHVSQNGKSLADLLAKYLSNKKIKKVIVIAHSMGGLIFRSALYYASLKQQQWQNKITQAFFLGSPHQGAPLEKFGAWTQSILENINIPYTKAVAKLINIRSNGIKDLRHGYLIDDEWLTAENDNFPVNRKTPLPLMDNIQYFVVASTIQQNTDSVISNWFGDIMVRKNSAMGKSKNPSLDLNIRDENILLLGSITHIKLLYDTRISEFLQNKIKEDLTL